MIHGGIPVVQLRRLRGELRRARESADLTQKQVANDLGWSVSKMIRIETSAANISTSDVMALLHYYKITDAERANDLIAITRTKDETWWWDEYRDIFGQNFINFLAYEDSATRMRQVQLFTVPGLLQTESYARALFARLDAETVELGVQVRLRRQELLSRRNGAEMLFVLDESVIRRLIRPTVMTEQLLHLKELNGQSHISIQILPFAAGLTTGIGGSFTIFDLPGETDGSLDYVAIIEQPKSDIPIPDNQETISSYVDAFSEIHELALSKPDTNELLDSVVNRLQ